MPFFVLVGLNIKKKMIAQNKSFKLALCALFIVSLYFWLITSMQHNKCECQPESDIPLWEQSIDFSKANYSNETGVPDGKYLVPNYIHFIRFNGKELKYLQMICILAAFKNQKPDKIFFHVNFKTTFEGKYWDVLKNTKGFMDVVVFNYVPIPTEIFGQPLDPSNSFSIYHAADVTRLKMLMKYGGIIVDSDTYIINNLNKFRVFEFALNWDENQFLGCQLLIAHKDSRFLKLYLESYRNGYRGDLWYYNAGERPTTEILYKQPELVHRVKILFGADTKYIGYIFQRQWEEWRAYFAVHLLANHQYLLHNLTEKATFPVNFNEENIAYYPITFRDMAYDLYDTAGNPWPKDYKS